MIERNIAKKTERAKTEGWRQRFLTRFLQTSFRLVRVCGLSDLSEEPANTSLTEEEKNWSEQVENLISFGFHVELDMSEDEYKATIPAFQSQPQRLKGRFDHPFLIDPRISLQRQLDLHKVIVNPQITEADLVRLSMRESAKSHIPNDPYQIWVRVDLRTFEQAHKTNSLAFRSAQEFTYDERGLTAIEGLAILREAPNILYSGFPNFEQEGMYLLDSGVGENIVLTLKPLSSFRLPGQVGVLGTYQVTDYTSSYNLVSCAKLPRK